MHKLPLDRLLTYKDCFDELKLRVYTKDLNATVERKDGEDTYTVVLVENGVRYPRVHTLKEAYAVIIELTKLLEPKLA